jgi:transmembrane sensor
MDTNEWTLLARYFSGELSPPEEQQVLEWVNRHPDHRLAFEQAKRLWQAADELPPPDPQTKSQWESLQKRLEAESEASTPVRRLVVPFRFYPWAAAAVFLILVGISWMIWPRPTTPPLAQAIPQPTMRSVAASDSVSVYYLPDSSRVWLNQHSALSYSDAYGQTERRVRLEGQAFFEVRSDAARPFFVQTDVTQTRVLGTSFEVKAYPADPTVEVFVASGKVAFYSDIDTLRTPMLLQPNEKGTFRRDQGLLIKNRERQPQRLAWRLLNNPIYQLEMRHPARFLKVSSQWHKNALNQTVLEGSIRNTASLTSYTDIRIQYTIMTRKGKEKVKSFTLHEAIAPGQSLSYKKSLMDILTRSSQISVEVAEAQAKVGSSH